MRLLLDEHYSPEIAVELRRRGHDVVATRERPHLAGHSDRVQFAAAPDERRAIVTENVGDFRPLLDAAMRAGEATFGLVCVNPRWFPRRRGEIGRLVNALDSLLRRFPEDEGVVARGGEMWLQEPGGG